VSDPSPCGPPGPNGGGEAERLRAGLLRLRGQLHDQVTGLDSYHLHVDRLNSLSDGGRIGVIALDFPDLAGLEAAYGFEMSDRFLRGVARSISGLLGRGLPESTLVAIDGVHGDSFLLFLTDNGRGEVLAPPDLPAFSTTLLTHVRGGIAGPGGSSRPRIECDAGYAMVCAAPAARFERRLSQAIREARGMTLRRSDRLRDEQGEELRAILASGRLRTHYQPIVDMEPGAIMGYEALTRGPENSAFEGPEALFAGSLARQLLPELDLLCRCQAIRNAHGFDMSKKLFLNSLPESLGSPGFDGGGFQKALEESALQPRNLVLEITERTSIQDFEAFGRELGPLRRRGFLVAIDDVGTGYSSLQTITEVQPDFIKIDLSLIKNIHRSLIKQELVHSLLQVGARIGAQVIAEGIETEDEYRMLRRCGVRYGQGFFFARPAPPFPGLARGGQS
jgi:EAL domain-containing protein (putative c-di-GMP-specific phosphodiesterase class I)/GGDEF domain-containing protein